jgi:hypothetical protein
LISPSGSRLIAALGVRPRDARFIACLAYGAEILVGQLLVVIENSVQLGRNGIWAR